jgi:hypothetical protein
MASPNASSRSHPIPAKRPPQGGPQAAGSQEPLLGTNSWERKINRPAPARAGRTTGSPMGAVVEAKVSQVMTDLISRAQLI